MAAYFELLKEEENILNGRRMSTECGCCPTIYFNYNKYTEIFRFSYLTITKRLLLKQLLLRMC